MPSSSTTHWNLKVKTTEKTNVKTFCRFAANHAEARYAGLTLYGSKGSDRCNRDTDSSANNTFQAERRKEKDSDRMKRRIGKFEEVGFKSEEDMISGSSS